MILCRRSNPQQSEAYAIKAVGCWGQAHQAAWGDLLNLIQSFHPSISGKAKRAQQAVKTLWSGELAKAIGIVGGRGRRLAVHRCWRCQLSGHQNTVVYGHGL